jgi:hypothetical protein
MKVQAFVEDLLQRCNPDAEMVLTKVMVIDKDEELIAVVDLPIVGIATNEDDNEVRVCIGTPEELPQEQRKDLLHYFGEFKIFFADNGEDYVPKTDNDTDPNT